MKFCVKCGNQLSDDAKFCACCGNPVSGGLKSVAQNPAVNATPAGYAQQPEANANATPAGYAQQPVNTAYTASVNYSAQPGFNGAPDASFAAERDHALQIVNRAIKHFEPYAEAFKEYYKLSATTLIRVARIPLIFAIIAVAFLFGVFGNILIMADSSTRMRGATPLGINQNVVILIICLVVFIVFAGLFIFNLLHNKKQEKLITARLRELDGILMNAYMSFPEHNLFAPRYSLPQIMDKVGNALLSGQAYTLPEAVAYVNRNLIGIYKGSNDIVLRQACESRVYKKYTDRILDENGNKALHFIIERA